MYIFSLGIVCLFGCLFVFESSFEIKNSSLCYFGAMRHGDWGGFVVMKCVVVVVFWSRHVLIAFMHIFFRGKIRNSLMRLLSQS